jgi:hypothetical protein
MTIPAEEGYYNQFDAAKRYVEVRARAGYPPQSQEFNELQAISRSIHQTLTDVLFKEGSIVKAEDGTFSQSVDGATLAMKGISFYASGLIHHVPAATLALPATGYAYVGVRLTEALVTADQDPALLDPAVEELNYGQPGANRLRVTAAWEMRTDATPEAGFIPVYTFLDRQQQLAVAVGQLDPVTRTLARRTYDESGNYVVNGFDLAVEAASDPDSTSFRLKVNNRNDANRAGSTAYVQGNQILKLVPEYLDVPKALDTDEAIDTYHRYAVTQDNSLASHRFLLFKQPVAAIDAVYAYFDKVVTVTGHSLNGFDEIPLGQDESLAEILQVFTAGDTSDAAIENPEKVYLNAVSNVGLGAYYLQGTRLYWNPIPSSEALAWESAVTYEKGAVVQYLQRDGENRYWRARKAHANKPPVKDLAGTIDAEYWQEVYLSEPAANDVYHVYLRYQRKLELAEFALYTSESGEHYLDLTYFLTNAGAQKPFFRNKTDGSTPGSELRVEYRYHLNRLDVVYLDGAGELRLALGQSAEKPIAPPVLPDVLALGSLLVKAGQGHAGTTVTAYNVKRLTMLELRELVERLNRAEYNAAVNDLNNQAIQRAGNSAALRGIVTESFIYTVDNLARRELRFDEASSSERSLDLIGQRFTLPMTAHTYHPPTGTAPGAQYTLTLATLSAEAKKLAGGEKLLTLSRAREVELGDLGQQLATGALQVNQFDEYVAGPSLTLDADNGAVENTDLTISSGASENFRKLIQNYEYDWQAYTEDRNRYATAFKTSGAASRGIPATMAPTLNGAHGSGFPAFSFVELRVDGRRPLIKGIKGAAGHGFICDMDGTRAVEADKTEVELLNKTKVVAYPASYLVQASAEGRFDVEFYIPEGITSGTVAVEARVLFTDKNLAAQAPYKAAALIGIVENTAELAQLARLIESPNKQYAPQFVQTAPLKLYHVTSPTTRTLLPDGNLQLANLTTDTANIELDVHFKLPVVSNGTVGVPGQVQVHVAHVSGVNIPLAPNNGYLTYDRDGVLQGPDVTNKFTVQWREVATDATERRITISGAGLTTVKVPLQFTVVLKNRDSVTAARIDLKVNNTSVDRVSANIIQLPAEIRTTGTQPVEIAATVTDGATVTLQGLPPGVTATSRDV